MCNTNVKYGIDSSKRYKTIVWSCYHSSIELINICKIYLDNQYGKKVYIAKTPSYIINNNLWIPYIAGLIDSDGTIKQNNTIQLDMCAKSIMVDVCNYLSSNGITYHFRASKPTRANESVCYRITINCNNIEFIKLLSTYMVHERKKSKLINNIYRPFSLKKYLSKSEADDILLKFSEQKYLNNHLNKQNMNACINLLRKDKNIGIGSLNVFKEFGFINEQKYNEILQRVYIKNISIIKDINVVNLSLENNHNNIFIGNIGFVSIKI